MSLLQLPLKHCGLKVIFKESSPGWEMIKEFNCNSPSTVALDRVPHRTAPW